MRILLADDYSSLLEGLHSLLSAGSYQLVDEVPDGLDALRLARKLRPDLILTGMHVPLCDGPAGTRLLKTELPEIKIVDLTTSTEEAGLYEALRSGASRYLLINFEPGELFEFLAAVKRGEALLSRESALGLRRECTRQAATFDAHAASAACGAPLEVPPRPQPTSQPGGPSGAEPVTELTMRQREILSLVAQGLTYKEVGAALYISENTVKYHMGQILQRLHLKNRERVVAYALRTGLLLTPLQEANPHNCTEG